jgi:hypothetical protein
MEMDTYTLKVVRITDAAIAVSEDLDEITNYDDKPIWLPKSQISIDYNEDMLEEGDVVDIDIPEWLAIDKELE